MIPCGTPEETGKKQISACPSIDSLHTAGDYEGKPDGKFSKYYQQCQIAKVETKVYYVE